MRDAVWHLNALHYDWKFCFGRGADSLFRNEKLRVEILGYEQKLQTEIFVLNENFQADCLASVCAKAVTESIMQNV